MRLQSEQLENILKDTEHPEHSLRNYLRPEIGNNLDFWPKTVIRRMMRGHKLRHDAFVRILQISGHYYTHDQWNLPWVLQAEWLRRIKQGIVTEEGKVWAAPRHGPRWQVAWNYGWQWYLCWTKTRQLEQRLGHVAAGKGAAGCQAIRRIGPTYSRQGLPG